MNGFFYLKLEGGQSACGKMLLGFADIKQALQLSHTNTCIPHQHGTHRDRIFHVTDFEG